MFVNFIFETFYREHKCVYAQTCTLVGHIVTRWKEYVVVGGIMNHIINDIIFLTIFLYNRDDYCL